MEPQVEDAEQGRGNTDPGRVVNVEQSQSTEPRGEEHQNKENSPIAAISVAVFIILALGAIAFLYYQNQQLKNMLANYQSQPAISPTPTATTDPTANWKTYTNNKYSFSFSYPGNTDVTETKVLSTGTIFELNGSFGSLEITRMSPKDILGVTIGTLTDQKVSTVSAQNILATKVTGLGGEAGSVPTTAIYFTKNNLTYLFLSGNDDGIMDQILSTFKFIQATPTPTSSPSPGTGCLYQGKTYQNGVSVPSGDKCNTCSCENGQVACTMMACL